MQLTEIGKHLKSVRVSKNISQKDLSDSSKMSLVMVYKVEKGDNVTIQSLQKYLTGLNQKIEVVGVNP